MGDDCLFFEATISLVQLKGVRFESGIPGFEPCFRRQTFFGRVIQVTQMLELQWLPSQAPGLIGSVLGLVGPASEYCVKMRQQI